MKPFTIPLLLLLCSISFAFTLPNPDIRIIHSDEMGTALRVFIQQPSMAYEDGYTRLLMPLEGTTHSVGRPELPIITRFIAIPYNATCTAHVSQLTYGYLQNLDITPYQSGTDYAPAAWSIDDAWYQKDHWFPEKIIELGQPAILRDVRIVPLTIRPFSYNPIKRELRIVESITIELEHAPGTCSNGKTNIRNSFSSTFRRLYEKTILNFTALYGQRGAERGSFLIIVPDALYNNVLPLAEWKHKRGDRTVVKKVSEVGSGSSQIKNYISTAYNTWNPPIDQVLLIGDIDGLPTFYEYDPRHGTYATDLQYSLLEGNDPFPDILLGRISVDNTFELDVVVAKTLGYEKSPYAPSTWLGKFLCVSGRDFLSQVETKIWVQEFVEDFGYTVDTLFARNGATATMISNAINNGRAYVNYRGGGWGYGWREPYYTTSEILNLSNDWKLPVMTSINCGSGKFNWGSGECFGERWIRSGTPTNPKGGVAFVGASHWTYASRNNPLDVGIYRAIFNDSLNVLGTAMNAGKLFTYQCYPEPDTTRVTFGVYHILGDPTLNLWTSIPTSINVTHPVMISLGNVGLTVEVTDQSNAPVANALVCLSKGTEVYAYDYTNSAGISSFQIRPATTGILDVTVTGLNRIPYEGTITVISNNLYVGYRNCFLDDDNSGGSSGNGDGLINPGETIEMAAVVENFGSQTAFNVTGLLRATSGFATVVDSLESFGTIAPGDTACSSEDFDFVASDMLRYGDSLGLSLLISDNDSTWYSYIPLPLFACKITYLTFNFIDAGNGKPEPGETGYLTVTVTNCGDATAETLAAILATADPYITINDSVGSFGDIVPEANASNSSDRFNISIAQQTYSGHDVTFQLYLTASGYYEDTISFTMTIEPLANTNPTGPDDYGYYAYDSYDTDYTEVPVYNWMELDPNYGGNGTLIPLGEDGTATIPIPFVFTFYGISYDSVSICSNGWIAAGFTHLTTYTNWPIPDTYGPAAMIAPFWDDLSDSLPMPHHVYYSYDTTSHRFIIEWSRIYHTYADSIPHPADPETFEAILCDAAYYPTLTGDGEILYQYMTIINPVSSTVGIEDHNETIALQYVYNGNYASGASAIDNGLAIKLTTDPPVVGIEEQEEIPRQQAFSFSIFPNPFTSVTRFEVRGTSKDEQIRIEIFDISGRLVSRLSLGTSPSQLIADVMWDGRDSSGNQLKSGVYIVKGCFGNNVHTRKLIKISFQ
jgi:hypothetical protein